VKLGVSGSGLPFGLGLLFCLGCVFGGLGIKVVSGLALINISHVLNIELSLIFFK
jgi:hypothetical protein